MGSSLETQTEPNHVPITDPMDGISSQGPERTLSPASVCTTNTFQQAQTLFIDFDGIHHAPSLLSRGPSQLTLNEKPDGLTRSASKMGLVPAAQNSERPVSFMNRETGQMMNYYPVPVPAVITLPQKLSNRPSPAVAAARHSKVMSSIPAAAREAASWPPPLFGSPDGPADTTRPDVGSNQPRRSVFDPRLRASEFFERGTRQADIQLIDGSATKTLTSILDASASAPVDAFTDHPIVGRAGRGVYRRAVSDRKPPMTKSITDPNLAMRRSVRHDSDGTNAPDFTSKRASSLSLLFSKKFSLSSLRQAASQQNLTIDDGRGHFQTVAEDDEEAPNEEDNSFASHEDRENAPGDDEEYEGSDASWDAIEDNEAEDFAPTTLLAELQMRKQKQKSRNRTVLPELQDGMRSTLLELDAIAQSQSTDRRNKRVNLAWEGPPQADAGGLGTAEAEDDDDDEDVPLELIREKRQQAKAAAKNPFNASGLLQRRERDDNEPLATRRARLRGEPVPVGNPSYLPPRTISRSDLGRFTRSQISLARPDPAPWDLHGGTMAAAVAEAEEEDETLARRKTRLASGSTTHPPIRTFSDELSHRFGPSTPTATPLDAARPPPEPHPDADTLAQIRERLKTEAQLTGQLPPPLPVSPAAPLTRPVLRSRHSLADLLAMHPTNPARRVSPGMGSAAATPAYASQSYAPPSYAGPPPMTVAPATGPVYGAFDAQGFFHPGRAMPYELARMQYYLQGAGGRQMPGFTAFPPPPGGPDHAGSGTYAASAERGGVAGRRVSGSRGGPQMEYVDRWRSGIGIGTGGGT